jgi:hypothetical protein
MKVYFIIYILLMVICGIWAMAHVNDVDKDGCFKIQWRVLLTFIMFLGAPFIAKLCGLI